MNRSQMIKSTLFFFVCWLIGTQCGWGQSGHTAKLIEEAKREKEVIIYGTMDLRGANLLNDKFRERYPFLDVKLNRFGSGNLVPRTLAEVRAVSNESETHRKGNIVNKRDVTTIKIPSGRSFVVHKGCGD